MEFEVYEPSEIISEDYQSLAEKLVAKIFKLSLIPNCNKKFVLIDGPKDITIELRCLPAIEVWVLLPKAYPSHMGPLFYSPSSFYSNFKTHFYQNLTSKWYENSIIAYECVVFIQDDFLNSFFELEDKGPIVINNRGQVQFKYNSSLEFSKVFEVAMEAQRRSFNSEEHECKICARRLLGEKFFFLSGCEHFFCLDCLKTMVSQAISSL